LAGSLWAADPIIGTWKLNIGKSKLPPDMSNIKELSFVIRERGDDYELVTKGIQKDGSQFFEKMISPKRGGFRKYEGGDRAEGISVLEVPMDDKTAYSIRLRNGRVISVTQWILSEDGRTWRAIGKARTSEGKPYEGLQWWEKQ
jgi:hypothetical protein